MDKLLGTLILVKKSSKGYRIKERKTARKKGKKMDLASLRTTPHRKITIMINEIDMTLLPCIIFLIFYSNNLDYSSARQLS